MRLYFLFFLSSLTIGLGFKSNGQTASRAFQAHKMVVKLKATSEVNNKGKSSSSEDFFKKWSFRSKKPVFSENAIRKAKSQRAMRINQKDGGIRIEDIYKVEVDQVTKALLDELNRDPQVEYAEPLYTYQPFGSPQADFTPNDPNLASQYYLDLINAYAAWGISQGSSDVVIAVTDSGIDINHPDLAGKSWENTAELNGTPGVDDDNNGYIDDFYGWDFADNDNNLVHGIGYRHGMQAIGVAAAASNNSIGMAGVGFNSKVMGLKVSPDQGQYNNYSNTFESLIYAAENGADVINMSWGRVGYPSRYEQEIINYLTETYDVVFVAAGGNVRGFHPHYPASYDNVISVTGSTKLFFWGGMTFQEKERWFNSSYNYNADILAPAESIYSLTFNNGYYSESGTSFAAPQVAGAAALLKSYAPTLNAKQIAELLRVSSDRSVYSIGTNADVVDLLGYGHLDVFKALDQKDNLSAIRMINLDWVSTSGGRKVQPGDQVTITCDFINYLANASNFSATLTEINNAVTITQGNFSTASINTSQSVSNSGTPFTFTVPISHDSDIPLVFKAIFSYNGGIDDYQFFQIDLNPKIDDLYNDGENAYNITVNYVTFGHDADGRFGKTGTYTQNHGVGFKYNGGPNLLNEGGLILATDASHVSDPIRTTPGAQNSDFTILEKPLLHQHETYPFVSVSSKYEDHSNNPNPVNVEVYQKITGYYTVADGNYYLVEYDLKNISGVTIPTLYAGIYTDWNISGANDFVQWDNDFQFGYTYDPVSGQYAGIKVLNKNRQFYAIDLDASTTNNNLVLTDAFTDAEKFQAVSSGLARTSAGGASGNDVAMVSGAVLSNITNQTEVRFAVLVAYGTSLESLQYSMEKGSQRGAVVDQAWTAVNGVSYSWLSNSSLEIRWNDLTTQEDFFIIQRATDSEFTQNVKFIHLPANSESFIDSGLTPGTTYYYRILAKRED